MKIAIIGGLGFIGRELSKYASRFGNTVNVYDLPDYSVTSEDTFDYYRINLDQDAPQSLSSADSMVILAARRPYAEFSFEDYENNVRIAERSFGFAKTCKIKNIVFASSKAVYSDQKTMPWSEEMYTSPLSLYGASKVAVEQLASFYNDRDELAVKCLRFAQVIGMGERKGYLINTLIDNALAKKQQIVYGDGSQSRQYIYIKDVCRAIMCALNNPDTGGVFNIGMPIAVSNLELAQCINEVFGNHGNLVCDTDKVMGTFCDEMSVKKADHILGFRAEYDLKGIFEDILRTELH